MVARAFDRLFGRARLSAWVRPAAGAATPPLPAGYTFRYLAARDLSTNPLFAERSRAERFRARAAAGHRGLAIVDAEDTVAAYFWLSGAGLAAPVPIALGLAVTFDADTGYVWDCRTAPAHRRRGLYAAGIGHGADLLAAAGARRVWIAAETDNPESERGIARAGFARAGTVAVRRLGPLLTAHGAGRRRWMHPGDASVPWRDLVSEEGAH